VGNCHNGKVARLNYFPKRGEIWLVSMEPVAGHEIGKTRPALIISNNRNNEFSSTVTVIPITSSIERVYPFEVLILKNESGLTSDSKIKCNQIRTVDKLRLIKPAGNLSPDKMKKVKKALMIHLDIPEKLF
jgi:mRNA interferase MazF